MAPKLPGKNTATREYYTPNPTTDSASNEEIDWPSGDEGLKSSQEATKSPRTPSSSSKNPTSAKSPGSGKGKSKATEPDEDDVEQEKKNETPSPTPSDVVLNADFRDVGELAKENERMMREGVGERERKARLEGMREALEGRREERMGGGKGKGKKKDGGEEE